MIIKRLFSFIFLLLFDREWQIDGVGKLIFLLLVLFSNQLFSQVYREARTRHRFAQLNVGLDLESSIGGATKYLDTNGNLQELNLHHVTRPRFILGGTHFWGHADLYIAIPLTAPQKETANQTIHHLRGVETVFKYYPYRIEQSKLRPFLGFSIAPFYYEQSNSNFDFGSGPELYYTGFPLLGGITYYHKKQLFEFGITWNHQKTKDYFLSRDSREKVSGPPLYVNFSYRLMLETTLSAERSWESGRTIELTADRAKNGDLNSFYAGLGLSSAFWLGESSYNTSRRPYMEQYGISIMPDFSLGYYHHAIDLNIGLAYRGYGTASNTYGVIQNATRKSLVFEVTKYLFDYHGFVPFIGPAISYENLDFAETFEGVATIADGQRKIGYGMTFGWDIRPNRLQTFILRTSLRWYPFLGLELPN